MHSVRLAIPYVYAVVCIILPIYAWNLSYAHSVAVLFWIPAGLLCLYNWKWIRAKCIGWPILWTMALTGITCFFFEFIALGMGVWGFGEKVAYMEIRIWDTPLEEFLFYWGAIPFCLFLYLHYYRLVEERIAPRPLPLISAWIVMGIPFTLLVFKMHKLIEHRRVLSYRSLGLTLGVFYLAMTFVEHLAILNQYWVYDYSRLWGPKLWEIPIEEFLLYYWLGPTFVAVLYHFLGFRPQIVLKASGPGSATPAKPEATAASPSTSHS